MRWWIVETGDQGMTSFWKHYMELERGYRQELAQVGFFPMYLRRHELRKTEVETPQPHEGKEGDSQS
mgnify:CR=1 FL=1